MATQHIDIPTTTPQTSKITNLVETLWSVDTQFARMRAIINAANGDYAAFATEFGFADAAAAQEFVNLFNDAYNRWVELPGGGPNAINFFKNRMG